MASRQQRFEIAERLTDSFDGVMHRRQLRENGLTWRDVNCEVAAGRWFCHGTHTVAVGRPELAGRALLWRAVWESGRLAALDGAAALLAHGLTGFTLDRIDVAIPHNARPHSVPGVRPRRRRELGDVNRNGLPRLRVATAVINAARWATSERQASLLVSMTVQQRLIAPTSLLLEWQNTRGVPRLSGLDRVFRDVCAGAQSLGELDFAGLCRRIGMPEPRRQELRKGPNGTSYLDCYWPEAQLHVEIDGRQHGEGLQHDDDTLRQNDVGLFDDTKTLRITLNSLRLNRERVMVQVAAAYWARRYQRLAS